MKHHHADGAFLILLFAVLVFFAIRNFRRKQDIRDLFAKGEYHGDRFQNLMSTLSSVNARCRDYTFGAERATRVSFRGHRVWIIFGSVGSLAPSRYGTRWLDEKNLYAVADTQDEITWMIANPDIFTPIHADSTFPFFWVNLSALKTNLQVER